ncbi:hypothetical protein ES288_A11G052000v1 [Gossypium darwinii]|uniref:Uncharacterized protein n=1 Tax=Gossypium darwinii TaxID=34276 RepID=A0A5D2EGI8_GOSDA|nr:hypothetical protein ES288_A11G052000v1 [Gossypium darwinii]
MAGHRNLIKILFFRCFQGEFARGLPGFSPLLLCLVPLYFFYPFCFPLFTSYTLQHTGWMHYPTSSSPTRNKLSKQLIFNHLQTSNPSEKRYFVYWEFAYVGFD